MSAKQIRHSASLTYRLIPLVHTVVMTVGTRAMYWHQHFTLVHWHMATDCNTDECEPETAELLLWWNKCVRLVDWLIPALHIPVAAHGRRLSYCRMFTWNLRTSVECETNPSLTLTGGSTDTGTSCYCSGTWKQITRTANKDCWTCDQWETNPLFCVILSLQGTIATRRKECPSFSRPPHWPLLPLHVTLMP